VAIRTPALVALEEARRAQVVEGVGGDVLGLIVAFMAAEVAGGLVAHSLALVSDAAQMLTDAASIGLAIVAMRLAARPPKGGYTYRLKRAEILSAQANGLTLLLSVWRRSP
jgi:cobalt-zinc-cadmium efflux system protein